jgi:histidine ammonia-lyase
VNVLLIDGESLTVEQIADVAKNNRKVSLAYEAVVKIEQSISDKIMNGPKVLDSCYCNFDGIKDEQIKELEINQYDNINSIPVSAEIVRAIMLICINSYSKGYLRVKKETILTLLEMLNEGVHPVIKENGVNSSLADIYPLAQIFMVMKGYGFAEYRGRIMTGKEAMKRAYIKPIIIDRKEEMEMINGPYAMMAISSLAVHNALVLSRAADITSSLTLEAVKYDIEPYDTVQHPKPHQGHVYAAYNIMGVLKESKNISNNTKLNYYNSCSLRSIPQVNGAVRMVIENSKKIVEAEIGSASYNPLIFSDSGDICSCLEPQGQNIAVALNTLKMSLKDMIDASKKRARLLDADTIGNIYPSNYTTHDSSLYQKELIRYLDILCIL